MQRLQVSIRLGGLHRCEWLGLIVPAPLVQICLRSTAAARVAAVDARRSLARAFSSLPEHEVVGLPALSPVRSLFRAVLTARGYG